MSVADPDETSAGMCVVVSSCVGGGPMERLARRLSGIGKRTRVLAGFAPERWRSLMAGGATARLAARAGALAVFPVRALCNALVDRGTVLVPTTNPFFLPFVLVATRPLHRKPVVPLVYDLYPDALEATGISRRGGSLGRLAEWANRFVFERSDGVVFIGERMREHATARYGTPRRWLVAETGADLDELAARGELVGAPQSDLERWCDGKVVFGYVGNMGQLHDWETLAVAVPRALERTRAPVGIVIAASGPGVERLRDAWRTLPAERVRFEPPLDDRAWARLLVRTHVSLVTLREGARHTSIPSKTFSAMAAGSAILAVAPANSDVADVVARSGCGMVFPPGRPNEVSSAIALLAERPPELEVLRANARRAVRERYDMQALAQRWSEFIDDVLEEAR